MTDGTHEDEESQTVGQPDLSSLLCVVGVAIKDHTGRIYQLPKPNRHHHVIKVMAEDGCKTPITGEQGFILSDGRFSNRVNAKFVAEKAGQLLDRASNGYKLFSECVW